MEIKSSDILLASGHVSEKRYERKESLVAGTSSRDDAWVPSRREGGTAVRRDMTQSAPPTETPSLLDQFRAGEPLSGATAVESGRPPSSVPPERQLASPIELKHEVPVMSLPEPVEGAVTEDMQPSVEDKAKVDLIVAAIESMTGRKIKISDPGELISQHVEPVDVESPSPPPEAGGGEPPPSAGGWGMRYSFHERYEESETTTFDAKGVVRTADGKEIEIDVALTMSRQFVSERHIEVVEGAAVQDPLAINFGGAAAELTQTKYQFDIDSDGTEDQISFVRPNSGFLALDKNGDGTVNNGSELFGPTTGDGFGELAAHDADQNGWIDEADPVYDRLRIWSKDPGGNDQLVALGRRGVGAVYLGHATTPFEMKDATNELHGVVRSSGIYLSEEGAPGTVQQVDLVV